MLETQLSFHGLVCDHIPLMHELSYLIFSASMTSLQVEELSIGVTFAQEREPRSLSCYSSLKRSKAKTFDHELFAK
jgi:hypothetical protein